MAGEHGSNGAEGFEVRRVSCAAGTFTFRQWMRRVNAEIVSIADVCADDIPDWDYASAWESGETPAGAAREALECASFPFDD